MKSTAITDIDLAFRPKSYFWPMGLETHLLASIKGAERHAALKALIDAGHLDAIPSLLKHSALSAADRSTLGRFHPAFMGGEYLPNLKGAEVMIARITIASTTQDVTCVYARRCKNRIHYRVVDEYGGDTLSGRATRTSVRPLTLGQLEAFFSSAWPLLDVLDCNFEHRGYDLDQMQDFVVSIDSQFYPDLDVLYRRMIRRWGTEQRELLQARQQRRSGPDEGRS